MINSTSSIFTIVFQLRTLQSNNTLLLCLLWQKKTSYYYQWQIKCKGFTCSHHYHLTLVLYVFVKTIHNFTESTHCIPTCYGHPFHCSDLTSRENKECLMRVSSANCTILGYTFLCKASSSHVQSGLEKKRPWNYKPGEHIRQQRPLEWRHFSKDRLTLWCHNIHMSWKKKNNHF